MKEEEENGIQENKEKDEDFSFERSKGCTVDFLMLILYIDNFVRSNFFFFLINPLQEKIHKSKDNQKNTNIFHNTHNIIICVSFQMNLIVYLFFQIIFLSKVKISDTQKSKVFQDAYSTA